MLKTTESAAIVNQVATFYMVDFGVRSSIIRVTDDPNQECPKSRA